MTPRTMGSNSNTAAGRIWSVLPVALPMIVFAPNWSYWLTSVQVPSNSERSGTKQGPLPPKSLS